ncbi:MAG: helicase, partial [Candidatus Auribacterota bacterium]|nr:helicase [Candidatus Auribacterota bacterium]
MLLDNEGTGKVGDVLGDVIRKDTRLSVLSGLFSIYGYAALKDQLNQISALRLLIPSSEGWSTAGGEDVFHLKDLAGGKMDRRFRNSLNLTEIARECARWLERKAEIRTVALPVAQNLFHAENPDGQNAAIHGSSSFTSGGFGVIPSDGYAMNTYFTAASETDGLLKWFNSIWNDPASTRDIKKFVLDQLDRFVSDKSPELIYFL